MKSEKKGLEEVLEGVDPEKRLLFVRGGVPGHNDALVRVRSSVKARGAQ